MYPKTEQEIKQTWKDNKSSPMVSICCTTYNHEPYIAKAIEGFLMQQTNFSFEILIRDDCSTDKTALIVKEYKNKYPGLIKAIFEKENTFSKGIKAMPQLYKISKGKYIALCEGDDYWTDPLKLQKQVDFLEEHPEYSLTCHRYKIYNNKTNEYKLDLAHKLFEKHNSDIEFDLNLFFKYWLTKTLTVVFRTEYLEFNEYGKYKHFKDVHLFYFLLKKGKGYAFNQYMAIYNIHSGGIWSSTHEFNWIKIPLDVYKELLYFNKNDINIQNVYKEQINALEKKINALMYQYKIPFLKPNFYKYLNLMYIHNTSIVLYLKLYLKSYFIFIKKIYNKIVLFKF